MSTSSETVEREPPVTVSNIDSAAIIADAAGTIDSANAHLGDLLGRSPDSVHGLNITELLYGAAASRLKRKIEDAINSKGEPWTENLAAQNANGQEIRLSAAFSVVGLSEGRAGVLVELSPSDASGNTNRRNGPSSPEEMTSMIASKDGHFSAGQLELVGLEDVRESLGDRWNELAAQVYEIADSILESDLDEKDTFQGDSQGNYIICFADVSDDEAWSRAQELGQQIRDALIGENADERLARFNLDSDTRERMSGVKAATYELDISEDEFGAVPDVMGLIRKKVSSATDKLREQAGSMLVALTENSGTRLRSVKMSTGKVAPFQIAEFDTVSQVKAEQLRNIYNDSPKIVAQLDSLRLGTTIERLCNMNATTIALTVVDVHYSTLANAESAEGFFDICGNSTTKTSDTLIFKVRDIPANAPQADLSERLKLLHKHSRLSAIHIVTPGLGNIDIAESRISLVFVDFTELKRWLVRDSASLLNLVERLRQLKVRVVVDNLNSALDLQVLKDVKPDFFAMHPLAG